MATMFNSEARKRTLEEADWDEDYIGDNGTKRAKLERVFGNLKLDEDNDSDDSTEQVQYRVIHNAGKSPFEIKHDAGDGVEYSGTTAYVAERMLSQYNELMKSRLQLIRPYNSQLVMAYRFQMWVVRMFNRFIKRYNEVHQARIRSVQSYYKLMLLVDQQQIEFGELVRIVLEENSIELRRLRLKFEKRSSSDSLDQSCLHYNYWDRDKIRLTDVDMDEDITWEPKIVELPPEAIGNVNGNGNGNDRKVGIDFTTDMDMDVDMD